MSIEKIDFIVSNFYFLFFLSFFFFFFCLFWIFVAACVLSLDVVSKGYSLVVVYSLLFAEHSTDSRVCKLH